MNARHLCSAIAGTLVLAAAATAVSTENDGAPSFQNNGEEASLGVGEVHRPFIPPDYGPRHRSRRAPGFDTSNGAGLGLFANDQGNVALADSSSLDEGQSETPYRRGDFTGDGQVDIADMVLLILNWGACPVITEVCSGDLNGDAFVDVDDLIALILRWD
jgi:hypothetical protein